MSERLWGILAYISPLVLGAIVPFILLLARKHALAAQDLQTEVLGLRRQLTDNQKNEILGALVAGLTHDLNNVNMAVMGNLDLALITGVGMPDKTRGSIEAARAAALKGTEVMQVVLKFSRGDREVTTGDVRKTIMEAEAIARLMLPKSIHLKSKLPTTPVVLTFNKIQLFQAIMNLVVNARDAVASVDKGTILVTLGSTPEAVTIQVIDNGCGIDPLILARIFDWQFTTKAEGHGTGLGLAIVAEAVKAMGGRVTVTSTLGEGTVFNLELPPGPAK